MRSFVRLSVFSTLIALGLAPAAAKQAPPAEPGPVLWETLQTGMGAGEVRGALKHHAVALTGSCTARVQPFYSHGRLVHVRLTGRDTFGAGPFCSERVRKSLAESYGASDGGLHNALEDRAWVYTGPSPLPRMFGSIDPASTLFEAWATKDKSVLFRTTRRGGHWTVDYVPNAVPVQNPTAL